MFLLQFPTEVIGNCDQAAFLSTQNCQKCLCEHDQGGTLSSGWSSRKKAILTKPGWSKSRPSITQQEPGSKVSRKNRQENLDWATLGRRQMCSSEAMNARSILLHSKSNSRKDKKSTFKLNSGIVQHQQRLETWRCSQVGIGLAVFISRCIAIKLGRNVHLHRHANPCDMSVLLNSCHQS